jgi:hypothetical protein
MLKWLDKPLVMVGERDRKNDGKMLGKNGSERENAQRDAPVSHDPFFRVQAGDNNRK